jgi:hypothetical protein
MRNLIDIVTEASLTAAELAKHDGKYLHILIDLIDQGQPLEVDPKYKEKLGDVVVASPANLPALRRALKSGDPANNLPKTLVVDQGGQKVSIPLGALFKSRVFTGAAGKKEYNAGHLAEVMMGLSVCAKFLALGDPITKDQVSELAKQIQTAVVPGSTSLQVTLNQIIKYPMPSAKEDTLTFYSRVPMTSAQVFMDQVKQNNLAGDLSAVLASAVKYANESQGVARACERVKQDKNKNKIEVISDGVSGTKADLSLLIDGQSIRLLSLKTYSTDTIGQISGTKFDTLAKWFDYSFNINIDKYKKDFDPEKLDKDELVGNVMKLYDRVIFPGVKKACDQQSPGQEAQIVRNLARSAIYHARGEGDEDVEVVKLDDKIKEGNYKVLKFSDDLYDAMKHLDLEAKLVGEGDRGRTVQIWVKPDKGQKVTKGANKLCQFRSQVMGGYLRNFYEIGPMMEQLAGLPGREGIDTNKDQPAGRLTGPGVKASKTAKAPETGSEILGRERRR